MIPKEMTSLKDVIRVRGGYAHTLFLTVDVSVYEYTFICNFNYFTRLGNGLSEVLVTIFEENELEP